MGCDIHCFLQKKNKEGNWRAIKEMEIQRDYDLFDIINNVRGNIFIPMAQPFTPTLAMADKDGYYDHPEYETILVATPLKEENDRWEEYEGFLGDHSFCLLDVKMMAKWKGWDKLEEHRVCCGIVLGNLFLELLYFGRYKARYIIGFDS